jgi:hypothetical protein
MKLIYLGEVTMKQWANVSQGLKLISILTFILIFSSCALHIPYGWEWDSQSRVIRVRLVIEPDDANVLLNGKWIGEAYEFGTFKTAIRLASRNNEIIIKKEGYLEEAVDLYQYYSRDITIRIKLVKDEDYTGSVKRKKPVRKPEPKKPEYTPKSEPERTPPQDLTEKSAEISAGKPVDVTLEILPEESSIYLNGKFWGISPKGGKIENFRLKPGKYTLAVVKPGYRTFEKELHVKDKPVNLSIKLVKK